MAFEANANSEKKPKLSKYANPINWFKGIWRFIAECKTEFQKITWPSRSKLMRSSGIVLVSVIVMTLVVWMIDSVFNLGLNYFFKVM